MLTNEVNSVTACSEKIQLFLNRRTKFVLANVSSCQSKNTFTESKMIRPMLVSRYMLSFFKYLMALVQRFRSTDALHKFFFDH